MSNVTRPATYPKLAIAVDLRKWRTWTLSFDQCLPGKELLGDSIHQQGEDIEDMYSTLPK